jgi:hypothetical protein
MYKKKFPEPYNLDRIIQTYNHASNPAALRTDREHRSYRRIAKVAFKMLEMHYHEGWDWMESDHSSQIFKPNSETSMKYFKKNGRFG